MLLTKSQVKILTFLTKQEASAQNIAGVLDMPLPSVYTTLSRMRKAGFVIEVGTIRNGPSRGRPTKLFTATEEGEKQA